MNTTVVNNFKFLKKAISKDKLNTFKGVCIENDYIYTTDGVRLHAIKNEQKITNGFYQVKYNTNNFAEIVIDENVKNFPKLNHIYNENLEKKLLFSSKFGKHFYSQTVTILLFKIFEESGLKFDYQYLVDATLIDDKVNISVLCEKILLIESESKLAIIMSLKDE